VRQTILGVAVAVMPLLGCSGESRPDKPQTTVLCDVIERPRLYDRHLIRFHARLESDCIEHTVFADQRCGRGVAAAYSSDITPHAVFEQIHDVVCGRRGLQGTLDKVVTGTFEGRFKYAPSARPWAWVEVTKVQDLRVRTVAVPAPTALWNVVQQGQKGSGKQ